ncbi:MAG: hypothetical protein IPF79_09135 [Ignavibacteria bacterium]|nr:hypothetical protein [Ignavibacteria bacterium]
MAAINEGTIRHLGEFALYVSSDSVSDDHLRTSLHPFTVMSIGKDGKERHFAIELDKDEFLERLHIFKGLISQLVKSELITVMRDGRSHSIRWHTGWRSGPNNSPSYDDSMTVINSMQKSLSSHLSGDKQNLIENETFVRLPDLGRYIANNYRTQDQIEHDDLKKQAVDARADAKRANIISIALAVGTVVLGLASVGLQWYSVTSTTKVDINSLPSTTRARPSFPQLQPR